MRMQQRGQREHEQQPQEQDQKQQKQPEARAVNGNNKTLPSLPASPTGTGSSSNEDVTVVIHRPQTPAGSGGDSRRSGEIHKTTEFSVNSMREKGVGVAERLVTVSSGGHLAAQGKADV